MLGLRAGLLGAVALLVSGCAYNDHFDNRVARFDLAAGQSRDAMILTNIIRASHAEPLSFFLLGKLSGSNTAAGQVGLPPLVLGPHLAAAATRQVQAETIFGASAGGGTGFLGNSVTFNGVTNFEINPSETKDFYKGLLSDVDPRYVEFFVQQGIARELLFYLFTEKLEISGLGPTFELKNDPLDPKFDQFKAFVSDAINYGISSEPVPTKAGNAKGASKSKDKTETKQQEKWQICFDRLHMTAPLSGNEPICGTNTVAPDNETVQFIRGGHRVTLRVVTRSTFSIFKYLGRILAAGDAGRIRLGSDDAVDRGPLRDEYLFVVDHELSGDCYLATEYEGQIYCVPKEGAANTKRIIGLLTQLIGLNTSISDIPLTQSVRVLPN